MTCAHTVDVGAYLLDALEPHEAERMREHLAGCGDCRRAHDELCGLPALLAALTPADVDDVVVPSELPESLCDELLARAAARRRVRTRNQLLGIAAAVVLAVVCVVTGAPWLPSTSVTVAATDPHTHVYASVTLTPREWGTELRLRLRGVASAQRCELVVSGAGGQRETAATWVADYEGVLDIDGTTAIPTGQISHLDVVTTSGRLLVGIPPPATAPGH